MRKWDSRDSTWSWPMRQRYLDEAKVRTLTPPTFVRTNDTCTLAVVRPSLRVPKTPRLAHHLADVLALLQLTFEFLQLEAERIAGRDHTERFAVFDDRHVTESAFVHHQ